MAHKKTTSKKVARASSRALRSKRTSASTKKLAGSALSQSPGMKHRSKDIVSPKSARPIRKELGITRRDHKVARRAMRRK